MKLLYASLYFCFFLLLTTAAHAQKPLHIGYYANPALNLYQRLHQPKNLLPSGVDRSSGQGLNILPQVAAGIWVGQARQWALGVELGVEYQPFSFNLQNYQGMGAVSFPLLLRGFIPLVRKQSSAISLQIAGGIQWNKAELYFRKTPKSAEQNHFFSTYVVEVSGGWSAISQKSNQIRGVDLFFRIGAGAQSALSFQTGLRLNFWNSLFATRPKPAKKAKTGKL